MVSFRGVKGFSTIPPTNTEVHRPCRKTTFLGKGPDLCTSMLVGGRVPRNHRLPPSIYLGPYIPRLDVGGRRVGAFCLISKS